MEYSPPVWNRFIDDDNSTLSALFDTLDTAIMLAFIFLFVALAFAYPNRGPCTGDCWTHDPAMLQRHSDGKYFRFATANGINIMSSDSVKGPWKDIGAALPEGTSIKIDGVDKKNLWVTLPLPWSICFSVNTE